MCAKVKRFSMIIGIFIIICFVSITAGFAATIIPMGKVSIVRDNDVIGYFNQVAQLPEGYLLRCEAKCIIQLDNLDFEVEPKTTFSLSQMTDHHFLTLEQGTVYYSINQYSQPLHFKTPLETITIGNLQMDSGELKGYVRSAKDATEIGVLGGGTMTLEIGSDKMPVLSGEKLTISAADEEKTALTTKKPRSGTTNNNYTIESIYNNNDRVGQVFGNASRGGRVGDGGSDGGRVGDGGPDGGGAGGGGPDGGGAGGGGSDGGGAGSSGSDGGGAGSSGSDGGGSGDGGKGGGQGGGKGGGKGGGRK